MVKNQVRYVVNLLHKFQVGWGKQNNHPGTLKLTFLESSHQKEWEKGQLHVKL